MATKLKSEWIEGKPEEDKVWGGKSVLITERPVAEGGTYTSNELEINIAKDGALLLSGDADGQFIYFYPQQLTHIHRAISVALKQRRAFAAAIRAQEGKVTG